MNKDPRVDTSVAASLLQPRTALGFYARAAFVALAGVGIATFLEAREQDALLTELSMSHGVEIGLAGGPLRACDQTLDGRLTSCRSLSRRNGDEVGSVTAQM